MSGDDVLCFPGEHRGCWGPFLIMKKILVLYYTQTGQLKQILDSLLLPLSKEPGILIEYQQIRPVEEYPFPWTRLEFLQVFPESVLETPIRLQALGDRLPGGYDLIILGFQPWYLSPSLPITSFLKSPEAGKLFAGADVLTVIGARNMWVQSFERVKQQVESLGGRLRGNIVLADRAPGMLSTITICYWMFTGRKGRFLGVFPKPGVSDADINSAGRYGDVIAPALLNGRLDELGAILKKLGAATPNVSLVRLEARAKKVFLLWARFIAKRPKRRTLLLNMFFVEVLLALFVVAPINSMVGLVMNGFRRDRQDRE